jgi:hypothetical protein
MYHVGIDIGNPQAHHGTPTIIVPLKILVENRIILDNVLRRRTSDTRTVRIEQSTLKVPGPELGLRECVGYVLRISSRDDRILLEQVVDKLGCDDDLDLAVDGFGSGVDKLAGSAFLLGIRGCLSVE